MSLNRYRVLGDGTHTFHTFKYNQKFNKNVWLENKHGIKKDNGEYEKHYKADMSLDTVAIQDDIDTAITKTIKDAKVKALDELVITHNTVAYDANGRAIGNMSAVMGVANFKFNQLLAQDVLPSDAYLLIYKETKIFWKGADDMPHEVMIESVCETLELSMLEVATIIGV